MYGIPGSNYTIASPRLVVDCSKYFHVYPHDITAFHCEVFTPGLEELNGTFTVEVGASVDMNGTLVQPWTFTKDKLNCYWYPGENADLLWYQVDPSHNFVEDTFWNEYYWVIGYHRKDKTTGLLRDGYLQGSIGPYPAVIMMPKIGLIPYTVHNNQRNSYHIIGSGMWSESPLLPPDTPDHSWSWWMDARIIARSNETVLRMSYYEGGPGDITACVTLIREDWYFRFSQNDNNYRGLVEIRQIARTTAFDPIPHAIYPTIPELQLVEMPIGSLDIYARRIE